MMLLKTKLEVESVKLTKATVWLKGVLVFSAVMLALVVFVGVPGYMRHVIYVRPDLSVWNLWMCGYGLLIAVPVWITMGLLWKVFDTLPGGNAFCMDNAIRFRRIAQLAGLDLGLVGILGAFLLINGITPVFIAGMLMMTIYGGIVAVIVFLVLSGLVKNASELKNDSDLTI